MVFISFQKFQGGVIQPESMFYTWSLGKDTVDTLYTQHHQQQGERGKVVTKSKNPWVRPINKK